MILFDFTDLLFASRTLLFPFYFFVFQLPAIYLSINARRCESLVSSVPPLVTHKRIIIHLHQQMANAKIVLFFPDRCSGTVWRSIVFICAYATSVEWMGIHVTCALCTVHYVVCTAQPKCISSMIRILPFSGRELTPFNYNFHCMAISCDIAHCITCTHLKRAESATFTQRKRYSSNKIPHKSHSIFKRIYSASFARSLFSIAATASIEIGRKRKYLECKRKKKDQ